MNKPTLHSTVRMNDHIRNSNGTWKTVCVTACLTTLGVPFDSIKVTGPLNKPNYLSLINRFGMTCRSRKSKVSKTIGQARKDIAKLNEDAVYFVVLWGGSYCHAILLDNDGKTLVDTDPRKFDRREIHSIHAVQRSA